MLVRARSSPASPRGANGGRPCGYDPWAALEREEDDEDDAGDRVAPLPTDHPRTPGVASPIAVSPTLAPSAIRAPPPLASRGRSTDAASVASGSPRDERISRDSASPRAPGGALRSANSFSVSNSPRVLLYPGRAGLESPTLVAASVGGSSPTPPSSSSSSSSSRRSPVPASWETRPAEEQPRYRRRDLRPGQRFAEIGWAVVLVRRVLRIWYRNLKLRLERRRRIQRAAVLRITKEGVDGNPEMYTMAALRQREHLRHHRMVRTILDRWWDEVRGDRDRVTFDAYRSMHHRLVTYLLPFTSKEERERMLRRDWEVDAQGGDSLTQEQFQDAVFVLADTWTSGVSLREYTSWLGSMYQRVVDTARAARNRDRVRNEGDFSRFHATGRSPSGAAIGGALPSVPRDHRRGSVASVASELSDVPIGHVTEEDRRLRALASQRAKGTPREAVSPSGIRTLHRTYVDATATATSSSPSAATRPASAALRGFGSTVATGRGEPLGSPPLLSSRSQTSSPRSPTLSPALPSAHHSSRSPSRASRSPSPRLERPTVSSRDSVGSIRSEPRGREGSGKRGDDSEREDRGSEQEDGEDEDEDEDEDDGSDEDDRSEGMNASAQRGRASAARPPSMFARERPRTSSSTAAAVGGGATAAVTRSLVATSYHDGVAGRVRNHVLPPRSPVLSSRRVPVPMATTAAVASASAEATTTTSTSPPAASPPTASRRLPHPPQASELRNASPSMRPRPSSSATPESVFRRLARPRDVAATDRVNRLLSRSFRLQSSATAQSTSLSPSASLIIDPDVPLHSRPSSETENPASNAPTRPPSVAQTTRSTPPVHHALEHLEADTNDVAADAVHALGRARLSPLGRSSSTPPDAAEGSRETPHTRPRSTLSEEPTSAVMALGMRPLSASDHRAASSLLPPSQPDSSSRPVSAHRPSTRPPSSMRPYSPSSTATTTATAAGAAISATRPSSAHRAREREPPPPSPSRASSPVRPPTSAAQPSSPLGTTHFTSRLPANLRRIVDERRNSQSGEDAAGAAPGDSRRRSLPAPVRATTLLSDTLPRAHGPPGQADPMNAGLDRSLRRRSVEEPFVDPRLRRKSVVRALAAFARIREVLQHATGHASAPERPSSAHQRHSSPRGSKFLSAVALAVKAADARKRAGGTAGVAEGSEGAHETRNRMSPTTLAEAVNKRHVTAADAAAAAAVLGHGAGRADPGDELGPAINLPVAPVVPISTIDDLDSAHERPSAQDESRHALTDEAGEGREEGRRGEDSGPTVEEHAPGAGVVQEDGASRAPEGPPMAGEPASTEASVAPERVAVISETEPTTEPAPASVLDSTAIAPDPTSDVAPLSSPTESSNPATATQAGPGSTKPTPPIPRQSSARARRLPNLSPNTAAPTSHRAGAPSVPSSTHGSSGPSPNRLFRRQRETAAEKARRMLQIIRGVDAFVEAGDPQRRRGTGAASPDSPSRPAPTGVPFAAHSVTSSTVNNAVASAASGAKESAGLSPVPPLRPAPVSRFHNPHAGTRPAAAASTRHRRRSLGPPKTGPSVWDEVGPLDQLDAAGDQSNGDSADGRLTEGGVVGTTSTTSPEAVAQGVPGLVFAPKVHQRFGLRVLAGDEPLPEQPAGGAPRDLPRGRRPSLSDRTGYEVRLSSSEAESDGEDVVGAMKREVAVPEDGPVLSGAVVVGGSVNESSTRAGEADDEREGRWDTMRPGASSLRSTTAPFTPMRPGLSRTTMTSSPRTKSPPVHRAWREIAPEAPHDGLARPVSPRSGLSLTGPPPLDLRAMLASRAAPSHTPLRGTGESPLERAGLSPRLFPDSETRPHSSVSARSAKRSPRAGMHEVEQTPVDAAPSAEESVILLAESIPTPAGETRRRVQSHVAFHGALRVLAHPDFAEDLFGRPLLLQLRRGEIRSDRPMSQAQMRRLPAFGRDVGDDAGKGGQSDAGRGGDGPEDDEEDEEARPIHAFDASAYGLPVAADARMTKALPATHAAMWTADEDGRNRVGRSTRVRLVGR